MKNKTDTCNANPIGERQVNYSQNDITASPRITQSETSLSYHNNFILLGFNDSNTAGSFSGYAYSNNHGKTWINGGTVPTNSGWTTGGDPVIAVDSKGIFYYVHLGTRVNPSGSIIQMNVALIDEVTKSINFKFPIQVSTLPGDVGPDKPWVAVGPDANRPGKEAIYIVWTDFQSPTQLLRFTKLSTGANPQVLIPPKTLIAESNFGVNVVVDKDGVVYVFYEDRALTPRKLRLFKSVDGGFNFNTTPIEVSDITKAGTDVVQVTESSGLVNRDVIIVEQDKKYIRTFEIPQAAIGPDNVIYVVWNDGRNQATTGDDIYLNYSINKGDNWLQDPIRITNNRAHEIQPSVAADCHGAHIQYTRFNSANNNVIGIGDGTFALFKKTFSLECGLSEESMVTSSFSRVPDTGLRPSGTGTTYTNFDPGIVPFYMGEYNQVIIGPDNTLLHSWSDNRHDVINGNNPDVFFIQTRSMDPCGESTPCECEKEHDCHEEDHKCHEDDNKCCKQDGINTENKNIYSPNNSFSPQIIIKQDPQEHPKVCPNPIHCSSSCYQ